MYTSPYSENATDFAGDLTSSRSTSGGFLNKVGRLGTICCNSSLERKIFHFHWTSRNLRFGKSAKGRCVDSSPCWWYAATSDECDGIGHCYNQGVHIQSTKAINHATAKHFRVSQAFIRGFKGEDGSIHVNKIGTNDNHSDFFTKALCVELFRKHRDVVMGPEHLQKYVPADIWLLSSPWKLSSRGSVGIFRYPTSIHHCVCLGTCLSSYYGYIRCIFLFILLWVSTLTYGSY